LKRPNGTEIRALFILSIIVPVGLVTSFRLTGILKEPPKVERITLEPVTLTLSRPTETIAITNKSVQNEWTQESALITANIDILSYHEGWADSPFYGYDGLTFKTYVNASVVRGYLSTVKISFHPVDAKAAVFVSEERWDLHLENATLISLHYWGANETDAYIKANALDSSCSVGSYIFWILLDENIQSHELQITAEVIHISEASSGIITIPIRLRIIPPEAG